MLTVEEVERTIFRLYTAVEGATLRREERQKAAELVGLIKVLRGALPTGAGRVPVIVDAAAGKGYVALLLAALVTEPQERVAHYVAIERSAERVALIAEALGRLALQHGRVELVAAGVGEGTKWPDEPDVVVALHACGAASDEVIAVATEKRARQIFVAPCCVAAALPAAQLASVRADELGLPRQAEVRRGFVETMVLGDRTLALEAVGYEVTVAPFVPSTVTPYNKLLRARRVGEPVRMRAAAERRARLWQAGTGTGSGSGTGTGSGSGTGTGSGSGTGTG